MSLYGTQKLCVTFVSNVPAKVFNKLYEPASLATGHHVLMRSIIYMNFKGGIKTSQKLIVKDKKVQFLGP